MRNAVESMDGRQEGLHAARVRQAEGNASSMLRRAGSFFDSQLSGALARSLHPRKADLKLQE